MTAEVVQVIVEFLYLLEVDIDENECLPRVLLVPLDTVHLEDLPVPITRVVEVGLYRAGLLPYFIGHLLGVRGAREGLDTVHQVVRR